MTIFFAIPKTSLIKEGVVLDLFRFEDARYCPVEHVHKLYRLCKRQGLGNKHNYVFQLDSGKMLTMSIMNFYLETLLPALLPDTTSKYSCHSFRAGLPSLMASMPEEFDEEDIQITGRWAGVTTRRYTRVHGIAQSNVMRRIHAVLRKN